jgi:hypothetical protein
MVTSNGILSRTACLPGYRAALAVKPAATAPLTKPPRTASKTSRLQSRKKYRCITYISHRRARKRDSDKTTWGYRVNSDDHDGGRVKPLDLNREKMSLQVLYPPTRWAVDGRESLRPIAVAHGWRVWPGLRPPFSSGTGSREQSALAFPTRRASLHSRCPPLIG